MGEPIKGAGDIVAAVTKFVGIQPCEACKRRQEKWNNMFPVKLRRNIRELTEEELTEWKAFKENLTLRITIEQAKHISKLYASIFNVPVYEPCATCSPKPLITMIERIDEIVKTYEEN